MHDWSDGWVREQRERTVLLPETQLVEKQFRVLVPEVRQEVRQRTVMVQDVRLEERQRAVTVVRPVPEKLTVLVSGSTR